MKIVTLIARILLGLVFLVFGLNGFLKLTKEARTENCNPDPMRFTGADLCCIRAQWFMADQSTEETRHVL